MTAHVKHVLIVVLIVGCVIGGLVIRGRYEAYVADRMAKRDEQISENQVKIANAQKTVQTATNANTAIDAQRDRQIAILQQQLSQKPNSVEIRGIVESILPGVKTVQAKDAQGNSVLAVPDTQESRDAINRAQVEFKTCRVNLDDCQQKQANFQTIIGAKDQQLEAQASTIGLQKKDIDDLRKFQVPRWTAMFGVGKAQGSTFQDVNSYQPFVGIDYRLSSRFGVFAAAQNKSTAVGISWRFGAIH